MTDVTFAKINQSVAKFSAEPSIMRELSDVFSFDVENKRYNPRFRSHLWDGKIRLFNLRNNTAPAGLIGEVSKYLIDRHYSFEDITDEELRDKSELEEATGFIESLKLPFNPRDYQEQGFREVLRKNRTLLLSPTGSGKSLIIYLIARWMEYTDRKTVIIVPSIGLVNQLISDFKDYSKNDTTFDVEKTVKGLHSKIKDKEVLGAKILISTWQSLATFSDEVYQEWDCVICDEVHKATAKILTKIINGAICARFKIGLTGSLSSSICHKYTLLGMFGSIVELATTKELQDKEQLNKMSLTMIELKYPKEEARELWRQTKELKKTYMDELEYLNSHPKRQLFIRNLACALKGTTLVLFRYRDHGKLLFDLIERKLKDTNPKRPVYYIDGNVDGKRREEIRNASDSGLNPILVFSVATSATGINIKSIENLIICPAKSRITTLQSIGRCLRIAKNKGESKVFDIVDDLRSGRRQNYLFKHATERLQTYLEQGFDVKFKEITLK